MKRLSGATLARACSSQPRPTRQRLLRAFVDVCLAVELAHTRGVVHRDLKPANIMLGDFGEVYVLDWGVARVLERRPEPRRSPTTSTRSTTPRRPATLLGTPGYMAPEQVERLPAAQRAADVYALGAILFEILAGEPLHPRGARPRSRARCRCARTSAPARAASRARDRARARCARASTALAADPDGAARPRAAWSRIGSSATSTAIATSGARRSLALAQLARSRARRSRSEAPEVAPIAIRAAGRALALDPEADGAAELVTSLMLEPPERPPAELTAAIQRAESEGVSRHARSAIPGYLTIAAFMPIAMVSGVLRWSPILGVLGFALVLAFCARQLVRRPDRTFGEMALYAMANAALLVMLSRLAGPFTFVPALTVYITFTVMTYPAFLRRPWALAIIMGGGFLVPIFLELTGVLPRTWEMLEGVGLVSRSGALEVSKRSSAIIVVMASLVTILMAARQSAVLARANRANQQRLVAQAWHLAQLLPRVAPRARSSGVSASA